MSSSSKNKLLTTILTANIPGCDCGRPKLSDVYDPTPKPKIQIHINPIHRSHSSSSSGDQNGKSFTGDDDEDQCTSTTVSFNNNSSLQSKPFDSAESTNPKNTKISSPNTTKTSGSIAVVKESNDPYQDFRQSMLQMIVEKQIYWKEDLQELLRCFLELNSPSHHDVIIRAFTQIWNDLISESKKPMII
ncbi:transcription repressor OFP6-like [Malus sylvestris]|uniref:transcription repressor OFP6-like n=1 Tax=Malus sylvestris TaxID=3752 RepID=UPI0021AC4D37|nr:transcription repressor OFP6-like [Malus sylvestris]